MRPVVFNIDWTNGKRTTVTAETRQTVNGHLIFHTADGLADVIALRGTYRQAWPVAK